MPKRVISVDDDRELVRMLSLRCRSLGLDVDAALDGFDAICSIFLGGGCELPDLKPQEWHRGFAQAACLRSSA